jgi:hypothetical protein
MDRSKQNGRRRPLDVEEWIKVRNVSTDTTYHFRSYTDLMQKSAMVNYHWPSMQIRFGFVVYLMFDGGKVALCHNVQEN